MLDFAFRNGRNPSSYQHHHRLLPPMFVSASPVGTRIQSRKPRITLQAYYDFTDIRSINLTQANGGTGGLNSSSANFSTLNPEKLMERSQELRLGRLAAAQSSARSPAARPSMLSSTMSFNHQSLLWPSYNAPSFSATRNRSPSNHIPEIFHHRTSRAANPSRTALLDSFQLGPNETRQKSLSKSKTTTPMKTSYQRQISKSKSPYPTSRSQAIAVAPVTTHAKEPSKPTPPIRMYESEEELETDEFHLAEPNIDAEYDDYIQKAITKCADWLIKYVFDQNYEQIDD